MLNQDLVTKMVDKRELRWFGHVIRMGSNRRPRRVWEKSWNGKGKKKAKDRMGTARAEDDERKSEELTRGD
jgi:hypothetical protein